MSWHPTAMMANIRFVLKQQTLAHALLSSILAVIFLMLEILQARWPPEHPQTARHDWSVSRGAKLAPGN